METQVFSCKPPETVHTLGFLLLIVSSRFQQVSFSVQTTFLAHARETAVGHLETAVGEQLREQVHRQGLLRQTFSKQITGLSKIGLGETIAQEVFQVQGTRSQGGDQAVECNVSCRPK